MTRRTLFRVLLSLLLLLSQQMAISHAVSHWSGSLGASVKAHEDADSRLSSAFAQDPTCNQCLAFAQLAGALGNPECRFSFAASASYALAGSLRHSNCIRTLVAFQPRAPPALV